MKRVLETGPDDVPPPAGIARLRMRNAAAATGVEPVERLKNMLRAVAVVWLAAAPARAAAGPDAADGDARACDAAAVVERQVEACTRLLATAAPSPADRARALFNRSQARETLGARDDALADVDEAIRLDPDQAAFFLHRGHLRRAGGDAPGAVADYGHAIALRPDDPEARRARADLLTNTNRDRDAVTDLDAILRVRPDDGNAYHDRGLARWRSLKIGAAPPDAGAADTGFAMLQRHLCLEVRGDCEDVALALADFGRAIDLLPGAARATPLFSRAALLAERGETGRALADDDEAVRLRPDVALYRLGRAEIRQRAGDLDGARADLDEALRLSPGDARTLVRRAELRRRTGDLDGARADLDEVLRRPATDESLDPREQILKLRRAVARPDEPGMGADLNELAITGAATAPDPSGGESVAVRLVPEAARRLAAFTTAHVGSRTQIRVGGTIVAEPRILSPIMEGSLLISGRFTPDQAASLAARLRAPGATMTFHAVE